MVTLRPRRRNRQATSHPGMHLKPPNRQTKRCLSGELPKTVNGRACPRHHCWAVDSAHGHPTTVCSTQLSTSVWHTHTDTRPRYAALSRPQASGTHTHPTTMCSAQPYTSVWHTHGHPTTVCSAQPSTSVWSDPLRTPLLMRRKQGAVPEGASREQRTKGRKRLALLALCWQWLTPLQRGKRRKEKNRNTLFQYKKKVITF